MTKRVALTVGGVVWVSVLLFGVLWSSGAREIQSHQRKLNKHHATYLEKQNLRLYNENQELKEELESLKATQSQSR